MESTSRIQSRKRKGTTNSSDNNGKVDDDVVEDSPSDNNNNNTTARNRKKLVSSKSNNNNDNNNNNGTSKKEEKALETSKRSNSQKDEEEPLDDKSEIGKVPTRPARVYVDGIFDLFHYGHALALKQAKDLFPYTCLIVGVCNDELTHKLKGLTVMTHAERAESLRHCRYVDEVVENAPWIVDQEFMDKHQIDFIAHGQDPVLDKDGNDIYQFAKDSGKFLYINRTDGISTSDLILRIIKEYDSYVARNIARGYSRKDLNVGLIKEKQIVMKQKLKKLKEEMEENHVYEFIKKFGDYLKQNWEGEKFPC